MAYKTRETTEHYEVCDYCESELCDKCGLGYCRGLDCYGVCDSQYCCDYAEQNSEIQGLTFSLNRLRNRLAKDKRLIDELETKDIPECEAKLKKCEAEFKTQPNKKRH